MTDFLIGTGGWAYFKVPNKTSLKSYSAVFNFVEVNYTFYDYPDTRIVEGWRRTVPEDFTFSVRCHQDLTHKIGLKPIDAAHQVLNKMISYCRLLGSPYLVLETPANYILNETDIKSAKDFFASANLHDIRLIWEIRTKIPNKVIDLMYEHNIIHCVDISKVKPTHWCDVGYTRLFGKGKHNLYQFTDQELHEIDENASKSKAGVVLMSYHGARMNSDAIRFQQFKKSGGFLSTTPYTGLDSIKFVLSEDKVFPSSKESLISKQGWKVVDLTAEKRVHLSDLLSKIHDKTYYSLEDVIKSLRTLNE